jgi:hypothetical protein
LVYETVTPNSGHNVNTLASVLKTMAFAAAYRSSYQSASGVEDLPEGKVKGM